MEVNNLRSQIFFVIRLEATFGGRMQNVSLLPQFLELNEVCTNGGGDAIRQFVTPNFARAACIEG